MKHQILVSAGLLLTPMFCLAESKHSEVFDLTCTPLSVDTPARTFHVVAAGDEQVEGGVVITEPGAGQVDMVIQTYENASCLKANGVVNTFNRFTGELTIKPGSSKWQCTKVGGKKF